MPRSKRAKLVSLTKVEKKTKAHKNEQMLQLQANADKWKYCWLFEVGNMRNAHLKSVRTLWKDSARMFFGRGAVMAKALGATPEEEHKPGLHKLAKRIQGQVGLFFTDSEPDEVTEWFADFKRPDFARAGNVATRTIILPAGPILQRHSDPPEPFPHNEEPQLRKLGLHTSMKRGVPTLEMPQTVCEQGKQLTPEQARLLKLLGERMVDFRVVLRAWWSADTSELTEVDGAISPVDGAGEDEDEDEDDDVEDIAE